LFFDPSFAFLSDNSFSCLVSLLLALAFPQARVKKIIKMDGDLGNVTKDSVALVAKAMVCPASLQLLFILRALF
jgi:hypothetical protein